MARSRTQLGHPRPKVQVRIYLSLQAGGKLILRGSPLRNIFVGGVESRILMSWHFVVSSTQLLLVKVESLAREVPSPPRRRGHAYGWQIAAAAQPFNNNQNKHKQQPRCDSLGAQQPGALWSQPAPHTNCFQFNENFNRKALCQKQLSLLGLVAMHGHGVYKVHKDPGSGLEICSSGGIPTSAPKQFAPNIVQGIYLAHTLDNQKFAYSGMFRARLSFVFHLAPKTFRYTRSATKATRVPIYPCTFRFLRCQFVGFSLQPWQPALLSPLHRLQRAG